MSLPVDERRIAEIVQKVMRDLRPEPATPPHEAAGERPRAAPDTRSSDPRSSDGVYPDIDSAVTAAGAAQRRLADLPMERRAALIAAMRHAAAENAPALAHAAWQETGMGRYEDKLEKMLLVAERTPGTESLQAHAWSGDRGLTLVERAPYGVIRGNHAEHEPDIDHPLQCDRDGLCGERCRLQCASRGPGVLRPDGAPAQPGDPPGRRPSRPGYVPGRADHRERPDPHAPPEGQAAGSDRRRA